MTELVMGFTLKHVLSYAMPFFTIKLMAAPENGMSLKGKIVGFSIQASLWSCA